MANFALDIKQWANATDDAMRDVLQATALKLLGRIIKRTPVDTGRARGNWQVGINTRPPGSTLDVDKSGRSTEASGGRNISRAKVSDRISIVNNLPYINVLEMGDHSSQAPNGMVRVTVTEFNTILDTTVKEER